MMLGKYLLLLLGCTSFLLSACSGDEGADAAALFLKEYKHVQFEVIRSERPTVEEQTNRLRAYVTDEVLDHMAANRTIELPLKAAEKQGADIAAEVSDIEVKVSAEGAYDLSYNVTLKLSGGAGGAGGAENELKFAGQSTVKRIDGGWKATRDYYRADVWLRWLE
jgi:hypothetical protein